MLSRIDHQGLSWVDIQHPSPGEIKKIAEEFSLPQLVSEELSRPSFHPKAEGFTDRLYLIFYLPLYDHRLEHHHSRELDIIAGEKFLLTIHYELIEPVTELFNKVEL